MKAATKSAAAPLTPQQLAAQETQQKFGKPERGWREQVYTVIFEAETRTGRAFDLLLIAAILISVTVVVLSSVASVAERYGTWLTALEWFFTILFTIEYCARLACLQHPVRYAKSFFGVIDLLAIVPTYIGLLLPGAHVLIDVRICACCACSVSSSSRRMCMNTRCWGEPCWPAGARSSFSCLLS